MPMNRPGVREISTGGYGGYGRCGSHDVGAHVVFLVNFRRKNLEKFSSVKVGVNRIFLLLKILILHLCSENIKKYC